jgi:hypothetical protein
VVAFCYYEELFMTHIKEVTPKDDYQLEVTLDNGSTIILNLKPKLDTLRFGLLRDTAVFRRTRTIEGNKANL